MPKPPINPQPIIVMSRPALDQAWFDALQEIDTQSNIVGLSRELFTVLGPDVQTLGRYREVYHKIPFNPDLRPVAAGTKTAKALAGPLAKLRQLRHTIESHEPDKSVRLAYVRKIDEVLLQNDMLIAAAEHDAAGFEAANLAVYGAPDPKIFAATCSWLRRHAQSLASSHNERVAKAASAVLETIPRTRSSHKRIIPSNAVFRRVRSLHAQPGGYDSQLFGDAVLPENVGVGHGDPVIRSAIKAIGADYVLADSSDELWGIVHHRRQVVRPVNYTLPLADFKGIMAHEVGSHLLERANGQRQPLRLLGVGLDRYECGNEGRAFVREQIVYTSPYDMLQHPAWEYICLKHLAISLAYGLYRKRFDFQELYEMIYPVCLLFQTVRRPDNPAYAEVIAHDETWNLLVRVLKGTGGFGGAYLKDIVYLQGNVRAWQMAAANPALILFGDVGKFDISNAEHLKIIAELGIEPSPAKKFQFRFRR